MGGASSKSCIHTFENPDLLKVVTLSDAAVQRLPSVTEDNPLEKEQRNQNIDDFWRNRLECMNNSFDESAKLTDREFSRLEYKIKKMAPGKGTLNCPRSVEDVTTCYLIYGHEPLLCQEVVKRLQLCLDTMMQDSARKKYLEEQRLGKKKKKKC